MVRSSSFSRLRSSTASDCVWRVLRPLAITNQSVYETTSRMSSITMSSASLSLRVWAMRWTRSLVSVRSPSPVSEAVRISGYHGAWSVQPLGFDDLAHGIGHQMADRLARADPAADLGRRDAHLRHPHHVGVAAERRAGPRRDRDPGGCAHPVRVVP